MDKIDAILGSEMFFVHKGTWENEYEWRIQKVKITVVKVIKKGQIAVEFNFGCINYDYPYSYLKSTLKAAKSFAILQINKEKIKQINSIKLISNG